MDKPDAIRLAEHLEEVWYQHKAAAELRRLHAENERLAAEVANRNRRALDGDEAVSALANVHAYYEGLEAQRDVLLQALKAAEPYLRHADVDYNVYVQCRAAIKAVEEGEK